jgi:hypothetical protein
MIMTCVSILVNRAVDKNDFDATKIAQRGVQQCLGAPVLVID